MTELPNFSIADVLNQSGKEFLQPLNCEWVKEEIAMRIGIYVWLMFAVIVWLMITSVLKSRGAKGKSCFRRYRGNEWIDLTHDYCLVILFVSVFWLLTYAGFGV